MKLFLYYALHSVKNQIKKLCRSWFIIFLIFCILFGAIIGIGVGLIAEHFSGDEDIPAEEEPGEVCPSIGQVVSYALAHRPDLQNARRQVESAALAVKEAKAQWYPQVVAFGNYGFSRSHSARFNSHYDRIVNFGLTATWNLFDGLNTQAAIHQAEAQLLASEKGLAAREDSLKSEVRTAYVSLQAAMEVLKKENSLLEVATRIRDLVREEYLGGTATITRLNEAQTNLTTTSLARSNAWIAVLTAQEQLYSVTAGYRLP